MRRAFITLALLVFLPVLLVPERPAPAQTNAPLYAPTIASPNSTLVGTAGPNGSVSIDFHETGNREEHQTVKANGAGRFVLKAPANAIGIDFSVGNVVERCVVSSDRKLIAGGLSPRHVVSGALAIVAAQAAYDVAQPLLLQVEHFNPLLGKLMVDGEAIDPLAASDRSVVGAISAYITLGRHSIGVIANERAVAVQADVVKTQLNITGPSDYRVPRTVTLYVDGLYGDRATTTFDVVGDAVLANNKDEIMVPVVPPGESTTTVKANHPGQIDLRWKLNLDLGLRYDLKIPPITYTTPEPTPVVEPTPQIPCGISLTDGWFEAVQGPYQDDPTFTEKPDRLIREDGKTISYYGQLDMVKDRPSALMGVLEYSKDGTLVKVDSRNNIVMKGYTNCSEYAGVKMRFTLHENRQAHVIYTSPITGYIFYKGNGENNVTPWEVHVPTFSGVPETPFTFIGGANHYAIEAELLDEHDHPLGMKMWLNGYVQVTQGPRLRLVPVLLSHSKSVSLTEQRTVALQEDAHRVQTELYENVPDAYPLKPHGLPMPEVALPVDLTDVVFDSKWDDAISFDSTIQNRYRQNLQAAFADRFGTTTGLEGVSRTIVILNAGDFDKLVGPGANGISMNTKLVATKWERPWTTSAHEVAHTLPEFLWSVDQMVAQCGKDYHNITSSLAYGLQTMKLSQPITGEQRYGWPMDIMQGSNEEGWISQCTYANLIDALHNATDPKVLMIRFYLAQPVHHGAAGKLRPAYETEGTLSPSIKDGTFAVSAYDARGNVLERDTFNPPWRDENGFDRNIISEQVRLKYDPAIASFDLRGPGNALLDSVRMSTHAPSVAVTRATRSGREISVAWRARGDPGRELLYSLFLSHDAKIFYEAAFEQKAAHAVLSVPPKFDPRYVKVVVTDGSRSSEAVARL